VSLYDNDWMLLYPPIAGIGAALLSVCGTLPYLRDVRAGRTRPHCGTWAIWGAIGIVGTAAQGAEGWQWSLAMVGAQTMTTLAVLALALRRGVRSVSTTNVAMAAFAAAGIAGWALSSDPRSATCCVVVADAIGVAMMLPKTWTDPYGETLTTFSVATVSGGLGIVAVGAVDPVLMMLPGYLCLANGVVAGLIVVRRRRLMHPSMHDHADRVCSRA
jgi:hypothetical protein